MDDHSDEALVARARQGDRRAFELLLGHHRPMLVTLCCRVLRDALLAEDAVQEASLQAFLNLDRLRDEARFGPWLHGIGLNVCRQMLRTRSRDYWSWEAMVGGSYVQEPPDLQPSLAEQAETRDLQKRIRYAVTALPPGQRAAVMLFYLAGLSYAETASILGVGVGAVRTRLHKARATLQTTLWTTWQEEAMENDTAADMVDLQIRDVWQVPAGGAAPGQILVILEETGGARRFPMWIGRVEGEALAAALERVETPRPMTYAFMVSLLQASGSRLQEVRIARLVENTYFAEVVVEGSAGRQTIDARPSDALNLAVRTGTPIRAAVEVLERSSWQGGKLSWEEAQRAMQERGIQPEHMPSREQFEHIDRVVRGETSGGAAAIVAELQR